MAKDGEQNMRYTVHPAAFYNRSGGVERGTPVRCDDYDSALACVRAITGGGFYAHYPNDVHGAEIYDAEGNIVFTVDNPEDLEVLQEMGKANKIR